MIVDNGCVAERPRAKMILKLVVKFAAEHLLGTRVY